MNRTLSDQEYVELYETLRNCFVAVDDWIVSYAGEFCDDEANKETKERKN